MVGRNRYLVLQCGQSLTEHLELNTLNFTLYERLTSRGLMKREPVQPNRGKGSTLRCVSRTEAVH